MRTLSFLFALVMLCACYRSHTRIDAVDASTPMDASSIDANVRDAALRDVPAVDLGPVACNDLVLTHTTQLTQGVSPRVVALADENVGVVHVNLDGEPTRVVYHRLNRDLSTAIGPVIVTDDAFSWAEIAARNNDVVVAYGGGNRQGSELVHMTPDGASTRAPIPIDLFHPSILEYVSDDQLLWGTFIMQATNSWSFSHFTADGVSLHAESIIECGAYGARHGSALRDDGSLFFSYLGEGPSSGFGAYMSSIGADGALGEQHLIENSQRDDQLTLVRIGNEAVLVREGAELMLERIDIQSFETLGVVRHPLQAGSVLAGEVEGHLVVAHFINGSLIWDFFSNDLTTFIRHQTNAPFAGTTGAWSVASQRGALVMAWSLANGSTGVPWLVRLECVN